MASHDYTIPSSFSECFQAPQTQEEKEEGQRIYESYNRTISTLPLETGWSPVLPLRHYQGFWIHQRLLLGIMAFRDHWEPRPTDILLASFMKSGTGWLRALTFATLNRASGAADQLLRGRHAYDCAAFLEELFASGRLPDMDAIPAPRLLSTHAPYSLLPDSAKRSDCKIVYICRDPKDTLVSLWHFVNEMTHKPDVPLDEAFELFCGGTSVYGPVWEHHLEYWRESVRRPDKVLFLKYEELAAEPERCVRKLAEHVGRPFSAEEEMAGAVGEVVRLCSFERLSALEVNRVGTRVSGLVKNASFFRKGKVGDWMQHLSPEMAERLDGITRQRLSGSGLSFTSANNNTAAAAAD